MATVQKFAALPFDKYLTLLEKIKEARDLKNDTDVHPPAVSYQRGGREISANKESYQSADKPIDIDSKQTSPPPPGLPVGGAEEIANINDGQSVDNWTDVWQALK